MGLGRILEHVGEGLYAVALKINTARIDLWTALLEQRDTDLRAKLLVDRAKRIDLRNAAEAAGTAATEAYIAWLKTVPTDKAAPEVPSAVIALMRAAALAQQELRNQDLLIEQQEYLILSIQKRLNRLRSSAQKEILTMAWCADYSTELEAGATVAMMEPPGGQLQSRLRVNIAPAHENAARLPHYGQLAPAMSHTPAGWAFNFMWMGFCQKMSPTWRYGKIYNINYAQNTCSVQLTTRGVRDLDINQKKEFNLNNVPIKYMNCDSLTFEEGDEVIVQFEMFDWAKRKVIGYRKNPRKCQVFIVYPKDEGNPNGFYYPGGALDYPTTHPAPDPAPDYRKRLALLSAMYDSTLKAWKYSARGGLFLQSGNQFYFPRKRNKYYNWEITGDVYSWWHSPVGDGPLGNQSVSTYQPVAFFSSSEYGYSDEEGYYADLPIILYKNGTSFAAFDKSGFIISGFGIARVEITNKDGSKSIETRYLVAFTKVKRGAFTIELVAYRRTDGVMVALSSVEIYKRTENKDYWSWPCRFNHEGSECFVIVSGMDNQSDSKTAFVGELKCKITHSKDETTFSCDDLVKYYGDSRNFDQTVNINERTETEVVNVGIGATNTRLKEGEILATIDPSYTLSYTVPFAAAYSQDNQLQISYLKETRNLAELKTISAEFENRYPLSDREWKVGTDRSSDYTNSLYEEKIEITFPSKTISFTRYSKEVRFLGNQLSDVHIVDFGTDETTRSSSSVISNEITWYNDCYLCFHYLSVCNNTFIYTMAKKEETVVVDINNVSNHDARHNLYGEEITLIDEHFLWNISKKTDTKKKKRYYYELLEFINGVNTNTDLFISPYITAQYITEINRNENIVLGPNDYWEGTLPATQTTYSEKTTTREYGEIIDEEKTTVRTGSLTPTIALVEPEYPNNPLNNTQIVHTEEDHGFQAGDIILFFEFVDDFRLLYNEIFKIKRVQKVLIDSAPGVSPVRSKRFVIYGNNFVNHRVNDEGKKPIAQLLHVSAYANLFSRYGIKGININDFRYYVPPYNDTYYNYYDTPYAYVRGFGFLNYGDYTYQESALKIITKPDLESIYPPQSITVVINDKPYFPLTDLPISVPNKNNREGLFYSFVIDERSKAPIPFSYLYSIKVKLKASKTECGTDAEFVFYKCTTNDKKTIQSLTINAASPPPPEFTSDTLTLHPIGLV